MQAHLHGFTSTTSSGAWTENRTITVSEIQDKDALIVYDSFQIQLIIGLLSVSYMTLPNMQ